MEGDHRYGKRRIAGHISIHALRVEGDTLANNLSIRKCISIHALRVEGDATVHLFEIIFGISIHALRVEGDSTGKYQNNKIGYFYPRPPGGGRLCIVITLQ